MMVGAVTGKTLDELYRVYNHHRLSSRHKRRTHQRVKLSKENQGFPNTHGFIS